MIQSLWDLFAYIWLLIGDVLAIFALIGAALTLLLATVDALRGRSPVRAFRVTSDWSIGALFLAFLCFVSVLISEQVVEPNTLLLGFSRASVSLMLALALALLVSSVILSRLIRR